jgi:L-fuculose-phosphate aldolase
MSAEDASLRAAIVAVCRRLYHSGLIAGPDGNVSVRRPDGMILVTPAGLSKVDVEPHDLVVLDPDGRHVDGARRASSEVAVHLRAYATRDDVGAVVHAHPPTATGFAVAGEGLAADVLPEIILQVGVVPLVPYETPGTTGLADRCEPVLRSHDAFLMANHGATTLGPTLLVAHQRMESVEHAARILLTARLLGRVQRLSEAQVQALEATRLAARPPRASR